MTGRPRIVLIGGDGGRSGVPRHIAHISAALSDWADLTIVSDKDQGGYSFARNLDHVEVSGLQTGLDPRAFLDAWRNLSALLRDRQADLVWAHSRLSLPLSRLATPKTSRLMVTYHGMPFGPGHGALRSAFSRLVDGAGLWLGPRQDLVFLSYEDRATMPPGWMRRHRAHFLPNCSDLGSYAAPMGEGSEMRRLVMLTRASWQKNLGLAASIFSALPQEFGLDIYGPGTDAPDVFAAFSARLSHSALARARFHGVTTHVADVLAGADGLLSTSRYEGMSISMIEAMEMGIPVFSTRVGGTELLGKVHPMFGTLTENPGVSARTIEAVVGAFRKDRVALSDKIHAAWSENFSPHPWRVRVRQLVQDVLQRPG